MSTTTDTTGPRFYRRPGGGLRRAVPNTWERVHTWFSVIFLVATFGPMFHWFATSTTLVLGIPFTIAWIVGWMVLQTLNMVGLYLTTVRKTAERVGREVEREEAVRKAGMRAGADAATRAREGR